MSLFILLLGISVMWGALGHNVHYQLGSVFFDTVICLMNIFSMVAVYYCFRASFNYARAGKEEKKLFINLVRIWLLLLIVVSVTRGDFLMIKVNAGLVLVYALYTHFKAHRTKEESGNLMIVYGILLSFVPIIIHTMKISLHEWFNYKDLAHAVMIISLLMIARGAKLNAEDMQVETTE